MPEFTARDFRLWIMKALVEGLTIRLADVYECDRADAPEKINRGLRAMQRWVEGGCKAE